MSIGYLNRRGATGGERAADVRMSSPALWKSCPWFELKNGTRDGFAYFNDFTGSYIQATNVAAAADTLLDSNITAFTNTTANTIASGVSPTDATGAMSLLIDTANEGIHVGFLTGRNLSTPIDIPSATNRYWWECRVKGINVTTDELAIFMGLMGVGRCVDMGTIVTGGALPASQPCAGWFKIDTGTTAIGTYYAATATTPTALSASAGTLPVATSYSKFGGTFNGSVHSFFQDGTAHATTLSLALGPASALAPYIGVMNGGAHTAKTISMDWIKVAALRVA